MIVVSRMMEGWSVTSCAARIASYREWTSSSYPVKPFVQSTCWVCQPYASYLLSTSSLNAMLVSSSIEMRLSSQTRIRLPRCCVPASELASEVTPSSRQPSPATT